MSVRQVGEHGLGIRLGHRARVDHGVGTQGAQPAGQLAQGGPVGVQMRAASEFGGLALAPVHEGNVVAAGHQLRGDPPADKPRPPENENPHPATVRRLPSPVSHFRYQQSPKLALSDSVNAAL